MITENYTIVQERISMSVDKRIISFSMRILFKKLEALGSAASYAIHR